MLCHAVGHAVLCCAILWVMLCHAVGRAVLCHAMLWFMLCFYIMLRCAVLCCGSCCAAQVGAGVATVNMLGMAHFDVKPGNILLRGALDSPSSFCLADLGGLSKLDSRGIAAVR